MFFFLSNFFLNRIENRSTIPDVYLSKTIPETNSPHQMPLLSTASQPQYHHQQSQPSTSASASASLISFSNTINASNEPAKTNSSTSGHVPPSPSYCNEMEQPTAEGENDSTTAIQIPSKSLIGCNGIKSNLNPSLNLIQFGDNASNNTTTTTNTINTGDNSNNDYCNTSSSGTGEAKAYKLLNSLS